MNEKEKKNLMKKIISEAIRCIEETAHGVIEAFDDEQTNSALDTSPFILIEFTTEQVKKRFENFTQEKMELQ